MGLNSYNYFCKREIDICESSDCVCICTSWEYEKIGKFSCKGYDTFGPFKLVGGIAKGRPNAKDLAAAVDFYRGLMK